jgi:hypothetical protein
MNTRVTRHVLAPAMLAALLSSVAFADELAADKSAAKTVATKVAAAKKTGPTAKAKEAPVEAKSLNGISILGNQEAPKALVIVPWKSSQLGDAQEISKTLDDSRQPVDKEVFMRELNYYEIRSGGGK